MKTISGILILITGMLVMVPKITTPALDYSLPNELKDTHVIDYTIRKKKQDIELLKSETKIILSQIDYKLSKNIKKR